MIALKLACLQITSGPDIAENLAMLEKLVREAAGNGAKLITTPENSCHMRAKSADKLQSAPYEQDHPAVPLFANLAKELNVWILIGSLSIKTSDSKLANRSYLFSPVGEVSAKYDKLHLFDVDLPTGERHRESDLFTGGQKAVVADTDFGRLGLTICYDVRFSYMFRELAKNGAGIIAVPAAFTVPTGQAHWEVLLRARAIETGSFIIAPAQVGEHDGGRRTWGHSLIIDPWGRILASGGDQPEIIYADIDLADVEKARNAIPALQHDRAIAF